MHTFLSSSAESVFGGHPEISKPSQSSVSLANQLSSQCIEACVN